MQRVSTLSHQSSVISQCGWNTALPSKANPFPLGMINKTVFKQKLLSLAPLPFQELMQLQELHRWNKRMKCSSPSPHFVKQATLLKHATKNSSWVETGTHLGATTKKLAAIALAVHTIEPSQQCLAIARKNLENVSNIILDAGTSEDCFEDACSAVAGNVCFWLDGHYFGGITHKGDRETPVSHELSVIQGHIGNYATVCILIDDIRCSHLHPDDFPSLDFYVDWARSNDLNWTIEHDIFIAKSKSLQIFPAPLA